MSEEGQSRKVTTILAADVAGYSRLMSADEAATVAALNARRAIFREHIEGRGGRVVDTAGDSVLAELKSVVEAVEAAVAIQAAIEQANAPEPEDRRMRFRIGVNLGDVIEQDDGTLYGDGVNIAARLEGLAEPGGVIISESAHLQVRRSADLAFADAGRHRVKNIPDPVRAFQVLAPGAAPARGALPKSALALAAAIAVVAGFVFWQATHAPEPVSVTEAPVTTDPVLAMPQGPVIVVLPFENVGGDPEQDYFSDGLTEDLITGLSRFRDLMVIGRNTSFQYKGRGVDARAVVEEIGARYVTEGSVRRAGETIRITAQLIDASDGTQLWTERYDRELTAANVFALQDEITERIVGAIAGSYGAISRDRLQETRPVGTENLEAYDCVLRAYAYEQQLTPEAHLETRDCLERAVVLDPGYAHAWSKLAFLYTDEFAFNYNARPNAPDRALEAARKGVELDPSSQTTHWHLARTHFWRNEVDEAIIEADRALALNPNNAFVLAAAGVYMAPTSSDGLARGVALTEKAMRIDPNPAGWYHVADILSHYQAGDYEAARQSSLKMNIPGFYMTHMWRLAIYGQLGRADAAAASLARLLELYPGFAEYAEYELDKFNVYPGLAEHLIDGWQKGGLFDEPEAPTKPVIAVLPFDNLGGDPEQGYFADGITEGVITELSRFSDLGVIARNSTMRYKGQAVEVRAVADELGATFVMEGSVQRSEARIRVTAQLIDAADGTHVWSDSYDHDLTANDIFAVQDDIAHHVATTIGDFHGVIPRAMSKASGDKQTSELSSYECVLRMYEYSIELDAESNARTRDCLERALEADPEYAEVPASLVEIYLDANASGWPTVHNPLDRALELGRRAVELDPNSQRAHWALAFAYFHRQERDSMLAEANKVIELNPNNAFWLGTAGWAIALAGDWERGARLILNGFELNPFHPGWHHYPLFINHYRQGEYEKALAEAQQFNLPDYFWSPMLFAAAYGQLGLVANAEQSIGELLSLNPDFADRPGFYIGNYVFEDEVVEHIVAGLAKAGLDIPE